MYSSTLQFCSKATIADTDVMHQCHYFVKGGSRSEGPPLLSLLRRDQRTNLDDSGTIS